MLGCGCVCVCVGGGWVCVCVCVAGCVCVLCFSFCLFVCLFICLTVCSFVCYLQVGFSTRAGTTQHHFYVLVLYQYCHWSHCLLKISIAFGKDVVIMQYLLKIGMKNKCKTFLIRTRTALVSQTFFFILLMSLMSQSHFKVCHKC